MFGAATWCARRPFAAMGLARASVRFDDMGAEPDGGEEDASQHLARVHFDTVRMTTMCGILDQARWGQLSQGWRSELGAPGRPPATSSLYTDGDWLAIEELRMLPPAKWEPAESVSWRESLEDWYLDSRDVADALTDLEQRFDASQRRSARRVRRARVKLDRTVRTRGTSPGPLSFSTLDTFERAIDTASASHELVRRKRRDWLEAQYRAGLVAGGEVLDHDWVEWFVDRVRSWPSDVAVRVTLEAAADVGFRQRFETLPGYWPH